MTEKETVKDEEEWVERERERENERKRLVQTELPFGHSYTAIVIGSKINIH